MGTTKQQTLGERSQEKAEVRRLANPLSCAVLPDPVSERPNLEYSRKTVKPDKPRGTTTQDVRLVLLLVLLLLLLCIFFVLMLPFFNLSSLLMCSYWCHSYVLPNDEMSGSWRNAGEAGLVISLEFMGIILTMVTKIDTFDSVQQIQTECKTTLFLRKTDLACDSASQLQVMTFHETLWMWLKAKGNWANGHFDRLRSKNGWAGLQLCAVKKGNIWHF